MFRSILCCLILMASALAAHADTFKLNFNDGVANTLTLTGSASSNGIYNITGATGTIDGFAATLSPINSYGNNDNLLLYPSQNGIYLDFNGLTFSLASGVQYNLYYNSNPGTFGYRYSYTGSAAYAVNSLTVTAETQTGPVAVAPEPSSLALLGTGLLGVAGAARRRFAA